jgi:hypothetical protein
MWAVRSPGEVRGAAPAEHTLPGGQFRVQPVEQPAEPFDLVAVDHRAGVRQRGQCIEGAVAAVDPIEMQVIGAMGEGQDRGQRTQGL